MGDQRYGPGPYPGDLSYEAMREQVAAHNDTPKPGEWWAFDLSPDHSGDWQPRQIPEDGGFPKCNRRRVYPDSFWAEVTDRMQAEIDEARAARAKANAECCEMKAELDQMREAVDAYRDERLEAREGRTFRLVLTERDEARRYLKGAIDERNVAEGRTDAALAFAEKWGEGHAGWAAILRGEDG